jgi:polar amino acid transport system substrate-binding protein
MRKKILVLVAVLAIAFGAICSVGCSGTNSSSETSETNSTGSTSAEGTSTDEKFTLVVGFDKEYPPFGFVGEDGEYTGFDIDLATEVAARNGWDVEFVPIDWDDKEKVLEDGTVNCIWNGFTMDGREDTFEFSEPYMLSAQVVVVKAGSDIESLEDLSGKKVVAQAGSSGQQILEGEKASLAATFASLETVSDYTAAFEMLDSGSVDAVVCDLSIAEFSARDNPDLYVKLSKENDITMERYAVGFKKGETELAEVISTTLNEMTDDGTLLKICDKYTEYGLDNNLAGVFNEDNKDIAVPSEDATETTE